MKRSLKRKIVVILIGTAILSLILFLSELILVDTEAVVTRNTYGEGEKLTEYELTVEGELEGETLQIEVGEKEYTEEELQKIFREVSDKLDKVILGENETFDRVEKDLDLVTSLEGYPVQIQWQLDSYSVLNMYGDIQEENLIAEGTLVELRGTISYKEEECIYSRYVRVYPLAREGTDKMLYEIQEEVKKQEEECFVICLIPVLR